MPGLTAVMYHYVRDTERTPYPGIKALSVSAFRGQLAYMQAKYTFVGLDEVIDAAKNGAADFPDNAAVLTFDDGYTDHFESAYPILHDLGIEGIFFPPAKPVLERALLDVNRIQFVLAACDDEDALVDFVRGAVEDRREAYGLESADHYWRTYAKPIGYDGAKVGFVKQMLQHALPDRVRSEFCDRLFRRFVTEDEASFADELYLSPNQIREMASGGAKFGSHGYAHNWMNTLSPAEQREDVAASLSFLAQLGIPLDDWVMCYPYGGYDECLVTTVRSMGCSLGFTTERAVADLAANDPLRLPRLDTNEIPKSP